MSSVALVQKLRENCNILRDDDVSCGPTEVEQRLRAVEELEAGVSGNLQRTTRLCQSILQKAFTGTLWNQM